MWVRGPDRWRMRCRRCRLRLNPLPHSASTVSVLCLSHSGGPSQNTAHFLGSLGVGLGPGRRKAREWMGGLLFCPFLHPVTWSVDLVVSHLGPCRAVPVPGGGGPRKDPRPVRLLWTALEDRSRHLSCHAALWILGLACRVASCWRILCSTVCAALLLWPRETLQDRSSQSSLLLGHFPPNFYHTYMCVCMCV